MGKMLYRIGLQFRPAHGGGGVGVINRQGPQFLRKVEEGGGLIPLDRWAGGPISLGPRNPVCVPGPTISARFERVMPADYIPGGYVKFNIIEFKG